MSYTYLLAEGEESLAECFSDIAQSVRSRLNPTAATSCYSDNATESFPGSQSGTTCEHSLAMSGVGESISSAADSPVRTLALLAMEQESTENVLACGPSSLESLAKYDPATSSWRTAQRSLLGGLVEYSETWPKWGLMRSGVVLRRKTPSGLVAHRNSIISERESGSSATTLPTPTVCGNYNRKGASKTSGDGLATAVRKMQRIPTPCAQDAKNSTLPPSLGGRDSVPGFMIRDGQTGGPLNPNWVEWLMGWPIGWTDLKPLETDKYQQWLLSHGAFYRGHSIEAA